MTLIKRYPNRKLYNTNAKQYVTLEGIATLIRQGAEVQIVDHATGEDLTTITLTQIIFEQEKKVGGFLPRAVLTGLVQSGGQTLSILRRSLASPLGLRFQVDIEIERRLQKLVALGHIAESEGKRLLQKLLNLDSADIEVFPQYETQIERLLSEKNIPTQNDLQQLNEQLNSLVNKLEELALESKTKSNIIVE